MEPEVTEWPTERKIRLWCPRCSMYFSWRPQFASAPFTVQGVEGIWWGDARGRVDDGVYVVEAVSHSRCGLMVDVVPDGQPVGTP